MIARQFVVTVVSDDGMAPPTPEDIMRFLSSDSHLRLDYGHHRIAVDTFPEKPDEPKPFGTSKRRFEVVLLAPFLSEGGPGLTEPIMAALTHVSSKVPNVLRVEELTHNAMPGPTGEEPAPALITPKAESVDKLMSNVLDGLRRARMRSKAEIEGAFVYTGAPVEPQDLTPDELLDWKRGYLRAKTGMEW